MIEKITVEKIASFDNTKRIEKKEDYGVISDLKKINFFYGANASGKTTISRIIDRESEEITTSLIADDSDKSDDYSIDWKSNKKLKTFVYNSDFIKENFVPGKDLPGIFTLGKDDADTQEKLASARDKLANITANIEAEKKMLRHQVKYGSSEGNAKKKGIDYAAGIEVKLEELEDGFADACWEYKTTHEDEFENSFSGKKTKKLFKERVLKAIETNKETSPDIKELGYLQEQANLLSKGGSVKKDNIAFIYPDKLIALKKHKILSKLVIGKENVDISEMITVLKNSTWVKDGIKYHNSNNKEFCPFCQQKTDATLAKNLEDYFDETYLTDIAAIEGLKKEYGELSQDAESYLNKLIDEKSEYLNDGKIRPHIDKFKLIIGDNITLIEDKLKEPSTRVTLASIEGVMDLIIREIDKENDAINKHNEIIDNITVEKKGLTTQIWNFIADKLSEEHKEYAKEKKEFEAAIKTLENKIEGLKIDKNGAETDINDLVAKTSGTEATIDEINVTLKSYGFNNFFLQESKKREGEGFYEIVRPSGEAVKETLSEGEKNFITFLYFYHLLKGSHKKDKITEERVVVIDDPVSSLDNNILYIVSRLIKKIFHGKSGKQSNKPDDTPSNIKQIFIFTHNIYFHERICFRAPKNCTYWIIRKDSGCSSVQGFKRNPIRSSYALLWKEVANPYRSIITIRNTLRRILEHYFEVICGNNLHTMVDGFVEDRDTSISNFMSWINDGSHGLGGEEYTEPNPQAIKYYLDVFKNIFTKSGQITHYNMMMKNNENNE